MKAAKKMGKKIQIQPKKSKKNSTFDLHNFFNQFRIERSSVIIFRPKNVNLGRVSTKVREIPWKQNFKNKSHTAFFIGMCREHQCQKTTFSCPHFFVNALQFQIYFPCALK